MVQLQPDPPDQKTEDRRQRTEKMEDAPRAHFKICLLSSVLRLLIRGCSSAGRAPALQAGGHRFDPVHLHHFRRLRTEDRRQKKMEDAPRAPFELCLQSSVLRPLGGQAVCSLTIWKKLATPWKCLVVWLGLDCMYRLLPFKSSMAMGATQALKSSL